MNTVPNINYGTQQLFVPFRISVEELYSTMQRELEFGRDIDVSVIILEMLYDIFLERSNNFGKFQGVLGSYQIQAAREFSHEEQIELEIQLFNYQSNLADTLSGLFPEMSMQPHSHYFYYPPQSRELIIYVPVTSDLSPELSSKAVPECAVRNSLRRS